MREPWPVPASRISSLGGWSPVPSVGGTGWISSNDTIKLASAP